MSRCFPRRLIQLKTIHAYAAAAAACRPSANSSIIFLLNAGMSSGFRLEGSERDPASHQRPANRARLASQQPETPQISEAFVNTVQRETDRVFPVGIVNSSIWFLISLAKAAAPAPFTTR